MAKISIFDMSLKIINLGVWLHLLVANELIILANTMSVHETTGRPLAQFDLILNWTTWELLWAT